MRAGTLSSSGEERMLVWRLLVRGTDSGEECRTVPKRVPAQSTPGQVARMPAFK